jgi:hypothetical protein
MIRISAERSKKVNKLCASGAERSKAALVVEALALEGTMKISTFENDLLELGYFGKRGQI